MENKKAILGQYFTKKEIVARIIDLIEQFYPLKKDLDILEPSSGTKNFVSVLKERGFNNITECEIDPELTSLPEDFFEVSLDKKFDLIIGNPPFTKYNIPESYYYPNKYFNGKVTPKLYLNNLLNKEKTQIENAFLLKSIKHLKDKNSSIGFVLPISFFIAKKNKEVKENLLNNFSTIIIYQNDKNWFEEPIPCCFAIFTNLEDYQNKAILIYEDGEKINEVLDIKNLVNEELIPQSFLYKKNLSMNGTPLSTYLSNKPVKYKRNFKDNNISGANILEKTKIPQAKNISKYSLAVVRVGNSSVGKAGLINLEEDILNDMFYVLNFKEEFNDNKELKEKIVEEINKNREHFKNSTIRVGSKSIKKTDLLEFKSENL